MKKLKTYEQVQGEYQARTGIKPTGKYLSKYLGVSQQIINWAIKHGSSKNCGSRICLRAKIAQFLGSSMDKIAWNVDKVKEEE